jgi:hypothetical protein
VVADLGLYRDRETQVFGHAGCFSDGLGDSPVGYWNPRLPEKFLGPEFLIGDFDTERAGSIRHRGLYTALLGAISELNETDVVEPQGWDPPSLCFFDNAARGGSEQVVLAQFLEPSDDRIEITGTLPRRGFDQGDGFNACEEAC